MEGMTLLQVYPIEAAGGIDRILQTASNLANRREQELNPPKIENLTLGARLKVTMWKGFTNQAASEEEENDSEESDRDEGNDTETPESPKSTGITSRLATTVWRGITNQSSMDAPPSPLSLSRSPSPLSHQQSSSTPESNYTDGSPQPSPSPAGPSKIWGYAEKLKDSDTAATLAKVSSNWRAMAMTGSWGLGGSASKSAPASPPSPSHAIRSASSSTMDNFRFGHPRQGSLPITDRTNVYSPPARPAYFRPPRDSVMGLPRKETWLSSPPDSPEMSPQSESGLTQKTRNIRASLASLTSVQPPVSRTPKAGPRPLLLNSSSLLTSQQPLPIMRSATNTPTPHQGQWSDVLRMKANFAHHTTQSVSSLSASDALGRSSWKPGNNSDRDSDSGSRVVPLNRKSVSPLAPRFMSPRERQGSVSSSGTTSDGGMSTPPLLAYRQGRNTSRPSIDKGSNEGRSSSGWSQAHKAHPSIALPSPSPPGTLIVTSPENGAVRIEGDEYQQESMMVRGSAILPLEPPPNPRKHIRKKTPPPNQLQTDDTSDSALEATSRIRPKQYSQSQRPKNLHIQGNPTSNDIVGEQKGPSPMTLAVQWPSEHESSTPKAANFSGEGSSSTSPVSPRSPRRLRKISTDGHEGRFRKGSGDGSERTRKVSASSYASRRKVRESAAIDGDDEGYDDLLSAYESEVGEAKSLR